MIHIGEAKNGISRWMKTKRDCYYKTATGRCKLVKGKECNRKNCKLLRGRGGLKINVYPIEINGKILPTILRQDILRWLDMFIIDCLKQSELILTKKDWGVINQMEEKNKVEYILLLLKRRFQCKLRRLKWNGIH